MKKVDVSLTLTSDESSQRLKIKGEYEEEKKHLVMVEQGEVPTKMTFDFKKRILTRETTDYKITIPFENKKETMMTIELIKEQQTLNLKIKTNTYTYKDQKLVVKYQILETNEQIEYQIEF